MTQQSQVQRVATSHGAIAFDEVGSKGTPVVFIHGNSTAGSAFDHQFTSSLLAERRMIRLDLPGHGNSDDAVNPATTYTRPGLADAVSEFLDTVSVRECVLVGWSLGGHVALELASRADGIKGIVISGTPPVGLDMSEGFKKSAVGPLMTKEQWDDEDITLFLSTVLGDDAVAQLKVSVARTDPLFRKTLFAAARSGAGANQKAFVESTSIPLAVVNGANDPLVNLNFVRGLAYTSLWKGECFELKDGGHSPFWTSPTRFNEILVSFLADLAA